MAPSPAATLQTQARALGDPTRHDVFRYLVDADRLVDVAELTDHFSLNHNAIRQHLAKLVAAELVVESVAPPSGRGRPRLRYAPNPAADSRWGLIGPYERLAVLLTEMLRSGESPEVVGERAGRRIRIGQQADHDEPLEAFTEVMTRQGFDPVVSQRDDAIEVILQSCPFASAALTDPDTVCQLHLGLARGAAQAVGGLVVDELVPKDPRRAQCRLRCHLS
jgi:predicted ArsR family transcriptional regulator